MVAQDGEDEAGHPLYAITDSGRAELRSWFENARRPHQPGP